MLSLAFTSPEWSLLCGTNTGVSSFLSLWEVSSSFRKLTLKIQVGLQNRLHSRIALTQKVPGQKPSRQPSRAPKLSIRAFLPQEKGILSSSFSSQFPTAADYLQNYGIHPELFSHKMCQGGKPFPAFISHEQPIICTANTGNICAFLSKESYCHTFSEAPLLTLDTTSKTEYKWGLLP